MNELNEDISKAEVFQSLYDTSPDLYRTIDLDGKIILCNKTYAEKIGFATNEIIGQSIFDHVGQKSHQNLKETFEHWRKTGQVTNNEIWLKRNDGVEFPVLLSANNLLDDNGRLIGSNTVLRDISELTQAKSEIDALKLKKLAIIGELSARISHDLRNPLTTMRTSLELLSVLDNQMVKKHNDVFKKINGAVIRMSHQIDEVMDYVKPKPLDINNYSLKEIIHDVVDQLQKQDNIVINLPQNDVKINCDKEKLEIVLSNLILNAIQAMNYHGVITLRIIDQASSVKIEVEDSGSGIPDELKEKIFEPLFTTRQIGTGLGLPSCKAIVEKHNGTLSFRTKIGQGTVFVIELPKSTS
jgi:PAS domain S-box-containing protein